MLTPKLVKPIWLSCMLLLTVSISVQVQADPSDPEADPRVIQLEQDKVALSQQLSDKSIRYAAMQDAQQYDSGLSASDSPVEARIRQLRDEIEVAVKQYEASGKVGMATGWVRQASFHAQ